MRVVDAKVRETGVVRALEVAAKAVEARVAEGMGWEAVVVTVQEEMVM